MIENEAKLVEAFKQVFKVEDEKVIKGMVYRDHGWDSVAHMLLMSIIEDSYDIMIEIDDVIDFSSYEKGKEILGKEYDVEFS